MANHLLCLDGLPDDLIARSILLKTDLATDSTEPVVLHLAGGESLRPAVALHLADLIAVAAGRGRDIIGDAVGPIGGMGALVWLSCPTRTINPAGYLFVEVPSFLREGALCFAHGGHLETAIPWLTREILGDLTTCLRRIVEFAETSEILGRRLDPGTLMHYGLLPAGPQGDDRAAYPEAGSGPAASSDMSADL